MVSLRLLIVLSVVALLHSVSLAEPKCLNWSWNRKFNRPISVYPSRQWKEDSCPSGICMLTSIHYEDKFSGFVLIGADCYRGDKRQLTSSYECEPAKYEESAQNNTYIICYCKAGTDSLCNGYELMFDPEGDDGQKSRALELRKIGIIAEWKNNSTGKREIDLQHFTCQELNLEIRKSGETVHKSNRAIPCKGTCAIKVTRVESQGINVMSDCRASTDQTEPYTCTHGEDTTGKFLECLCVGSRCNKAYRRPFDPEGDDGQKGRAAELRKIGVIAKVEMTNGIRSIKIVADEKTTIEPTTETATEASATVPDDITVTDDVTVPEETTAEKATDDDFGKTTIETPEAVVTPSSDPSSITESPSDAGNSEEESGRGGGGSSGKIPRARDEDEPMNGYGQPSNVVRNGFALLSMVSVWMFIR